MAEPNGKKVFDASIQTKWAIRSGVSKVVMVDHDTLSETAEVLVNNEGLAIPSLLKVQSGLLGNLEGWLCICDWKFSIL